MLNCAFEVTALDGGKFRHHCPTCNRTVVSRKSHLTADCGEREDDSELLIAADASDELAPGGVGTWLHELIVMIGIDLTCKACRAYAVYLNSMGPLWCRQHLTKIIERLQQRAEQKGFTSIESQTTWMVELAITLAEEQREPTRWERVRLRAMRLGNALVNGAAG